MTPTLRRIVPVAAAVAAAALVVTAVVAAGRALPLPRIGSPAEASAWVERAGAPVVAFTVLRAVVGVLAAWVAISWTVGVCARVVDHRGAIAFTDRLSAPGVRRLAAAAAAVVALSSTAPAQAGQVAVSEVPTMVDLGPVLVDLGPAEAVTTPTADPARPSAPSPAPHPTAAATWVVAPGDTLWHVAEATAPTSGVVPTGTEVADQLDRLIRLNADRLLVPGDPDLVLPGQEFLIP